MGVPLLLALLLLPLAVVALTPLILIQRYRLATARRLARPWIATFTLVSMLFSVMFFVVVAAVTTVLDSEGVLRRGSRPGRRICIGGSWVGVDPMGTHAAHAALHAQPMAGPHTHLRGLRARDLRALAIMGRCAIGPLRHVRRHRFWCARIACGRRNRAWLLSRLQRGTAMADPYLAAAGATSDVKSFVRTSLRVASPKSLSKRVLHSPRSRPEARRELRRDVSPSRPCREGRQPLDASGSRG